MQFPIHRGDRVLDIGCAYGLFLKLLQEKGAETYGMDVSEHAIQRARENVAGELTVADANEPLPYPDSFFRLVSLFDVIEHLDSPGRALSEIHRVLEPGGLLALTTVNGHASSRFLKPSYWMGDKDPTHLHVFDRSSLRRLLDEFGFLAISIRTPFNSLPDRLSRIIERTGFGGQMFATAVPRLTT